MSFRSSQATFKDEPEVELSSAEQCSSGYSQGQTTEGHGLHHSPEQGAAVRGWDASSFFGWLTMLQMLLIHGVMLHAPCRS